MYVAVFLVMMKFILSSLCYLQTIEHLNTNINLEHLDLSENRIVHVSDISHLKLLKVRLMMHCRIVYRTLKTVCTAVNSAP